MDKDKRAKGKARGWLTLSAALLVCLSGGFIVGKKYGERELEGSAGGPPRVKGPWVAVAGYTAGTLPAASATQPRTLEPICTNTCPTANDGVCNDGRPGLKPPAQASPGGYLTVTCDLGTDCGDCGPWTPSAPPAWLSGAGEGPMALLRRKGVIVRVKRSGTTPPFDFAYTDPKADFDVSGHMEATGVVEAGITSIFHHILKGGCQLPGGKRALFVDVGANFGWYTMLAASHGCRAMSFEPVPHFHAFLEYSVHLNGLAHLVDLRSNVVSHVGGGSTMEMVVPTRGIWGTAGIGGLNIDKAVESERESFHVVSVTLDEVVVEDVLLLKVDVEGWEWAVLKGAVRVLTKQRLDHIIMEYSPGVPERHFKHDDIIATVQMLIDMAKAQFRIGHVGDMMKHIGPGRWDQALDSLEEVKLDNLKYDLHDAQLWKDGKLGCPVPDELSSKFEGWKYCNILPEDPNPRSLRSIIGHNTNLWAARGDGLKLLKLSGDVGILKLGTPAAEYFIPKTSGFGMGSRICADLAAPVMVRHRCPCTKPECKAEEEAVRKAAAEGKIATNYVLP